MNWMRHPAMDPPVMMELSQLVVALLTIGRARDSSDNAIQDPNK
jgi:hypothetical protein